MAAIAGGSGARVRRPRLRACAVSAVMAAALAVPGGAAATPLTPVVTATQSPPLTASLTASTGTHWTWTVSLDARPVAVCVHPYLRRIECARALRQFTEAVSAGVPAADGLRLFGDRALRGYDEPHPDRNAR